MIAEMEKGGTTNVLLQQSIQNIENELGQEYFNEALYQAINLADSSRRARLLAKLICKAAVNENIRKEFWAYVDLVNRILMTDLDNIQRHYHSAFKKRDFVVIENEGIKQASFIWIDSEALNPDILRRKLGQNVMNRLFNLGLAFKDDIGHNYVGRDLERFLVAIDFIEASSIDSLRNKHLSSFRANK